ncbi:MAG: peptidoglycan DD-metalloendopeptidase family protein [Gammaproteobacteria bacterium]|nr:peptidoglycan DD-metalloendopeptidase family protein [Gammaproteobacteria bacterium]MDH5800110.1 peptidoglycan DD-metalloendopeptidase family protein [Gammaproteobacteria bacterium]
MFTKNNCCDTTRKLESQLNFYERCLSSSLLVIVFSVLVLLGAKAYTKQDGENPVNPLSNNDSVAAYNDSTPSFTVPMLDSFTVPSAPVSTPAGYWKSYKVAKGQNLALIFKQLDINTDYLRAMIQADPLAKRLQQIKPGQLIKIRYVNDDFAGLEYVAEPTYSLVALREGDSFVLSENKKQYEKKTHRASATIHSSLFIAAKKAGISEKTAMELAQLFGWDIDFALDIRDGDKFSVVYQTLHHGGKKIKTGNILAAEFVNKGKVYRAVRYTDPEGNSGYYNPQGENMHKPFLRTPVDFTRISSRFGSRYHPVLNKMRSHNGVDYAAPHGTVVKTAGDGKIIFRGTLRGYGKTVIVEHGAQYRTLYAHLQSYNKKQRTGTVVKQGQTIGYVGSSGLATGPHLHYEFLVNGEHRNPLTVKLPTAKPLNEKYVADFQQKASYSLSMLKSTTGNLLAMNSFAQ